MAQTFTVERTSTIAAPATRIYPLLANFHEWRAWSPWEEVDPNLERAYSGAESGVGAKYAWSGNRKAGQGTMTITEADENERVVIDLLFLKPFKSRNTTTFFLEEVDGQTKVIWRMVGPKSFLMRVMGLFMNFDKLIGQDFEKGLAKLATAAKSAQ